MPQTIFRALPASGQCTLIKDNILQHRELKEACRKKQIYGPKSD